MVMTHAGVPGDSPGATGWTMALDKLAAHVQAHIDTDSARREGVPLLPKTIRTLKQESAFR